MSIPVQSLPAAREIVGGGPLSVGLQSVLYNNAFPQVARAVAAIARAGELAIRGGSCARLSLHYGDSSPRPCLTDEEVATLAARHEDVVDFHYVFFDGNLGSARGHNELARINTADILLIQNPDVIVSPRLVEVMLGEFANPGVGMVEAKQLPIEHPKDYDARTGETGWATTACAMIPASLFRHLGGFDADTFFLYCDDVDFSWQVRRAGFKVIFQPAAMAFHDKRLAHDGAWLPSGAEKYYSAEAALLIAYKWSRADLTARILKRFKSSHVDHLEKAAAAFERRSAEGRLPAQIDPDHRIGEFIDDMYARHRFPL